MLMDIASQAYPPEVAFYHVNGVTDTLVALSVVEFYNNEIC